VPNPPQPDRTVTIARPDRCYNGYTLFCHTYENPSTARDGLAHMYLINMEGRPVYEWTARTAVQLLELLPDGTLCYSTRDRSNIDQAGLYRIGPDSSVLWHYHCRVDHDFHVMDEGHLMIHCLMDRMVPQLGSGLRRNSYIVEIGPNEELLWEWHGEAHIEELVDLCGLEIPINCFDWAHNNTCEVLPDNSSAARDPRFRAGNILFSCRSLDIVGVIDRQSSAIVWAWGPGELDGQHQPTMLANGHILMYDNGTRRGWSRVIELDPLAGRIVWEYVGAPRRSFYSPYISGVQRLPNGNTFICEGDPGRLLGVMPRLFEVTPEGEIVWEFRSPYGEKDSTYGVYRATRYAPGFVESLPLGLGV
jgi:hypothetical protein